MAKKSKTVFVGMSPKKSLRDYSGQAGGSKKKTLVFVATYTNEGLKFQIHHGPLKFEPHKRGRHPKLPVAVI